MKEARLVMKPNKYTKNAIDRVSLQGDTPIKAGLYISLGKRIGGSYSNNYNKNVNLSEIGIVRLDFEPVVITCEEHEDLIVFEGNVYNEHLLSNVVISYQLGELDVIIDREPYTYYSFSIPAFTLQNFESIDVKITGINRETNRNVEVIITIPIVFETCGGIFVTEDRVFNFTINGVYYTAYSINELISIMKKNNITVEVENI
jgi:hypothetical protein